MCALVTGVQTCALPIEEVVRIFGYDAVPSTPLPRAEGVAKPTATPEQLTERTLRRAVAARGLDEAVTWSFVAHAEAEAFGGGDGTLDNPISAEIGSGTGRDRACQFVELWVVADS